MHYTYHLQHRLARFLLFSLFFIFAYSTFAQLPTCPGDGFGGNKRVNISAVTPQIHLSDSIGEAPFYVYASAFQTTATGTNHPFEDVEYTWDFGDQSQTAGHLFRHPVDSTSMSANTDQSGPEAAYLFESPGTYTITLTARGWNGSAYVSASISKTVTVNAWSGQDRYFDPTGGSDSNSGTTSGAAWQSWDQLKTWLNGGNNRRALIKRGETMAVTSTFSTKKSALRISAYGNGSKPVLLAASSLGTDVFIFANGTNAFVSGHVFTEVIFDANSQSSSAYAGYSDNTGSLDEMVFANCEFRNGGVQNLVLTTGAGPKSQILLWDCIFNSNVGDKQGFGPAFTPYCAVVGGYFDGGTGNQVLDHHMYINYCNHTLIRWVQFGPSPSRNFCLNMNSPSYNADFLYTLIDGCDITGTNNGIDFSNGNNDNTGHFSHAIVQNCALHDLGTTGQGIGVMGYSIRDLTVRNSRFYNNPQHDFYILDTDNIYSVYRNRFFTPAGMPHTSIIIQENQRGQFTDNIFDDQTSSGGAHFSGKLDSTANWFIDYNEYNHPNMSTAFYEATSSTSLDFSGWQGLGYDLNGQVSDPLFPAPEIGDFGRLPQANFTSNVVQDVANFTNQTALNPPGWMLTHSWDFGDGTPLGSAASPSHQYATTGTFNVVLTETNTCGTDTASGQVSIIVTGLDAGQGAPELQAYPNPTKGNLSLAGLPSDGTNVELEVFDAQMQRVKLPMHTQGLGTVEINLKGLSRGTYFLKVNASEWQKTMRVILL